MSELPKKLKYSNRNKTILTVKKHIHNYLDEPVENIEILCKNFPVADSHTLEFVKKTKWQNNQKCLILMYRRKKRLIFKMTGASAAILSASKSMNEMNENTNRTSKN